jgi:ABC-type phosphate/phosphonate transport system substrate-binding protein|tara:strand:- start:282 stop:473 length:192 start_codon:yes stop_codon:yes gene_type:complete
MSRYTGKDFEDEVSVAMDELKNTKSNKRLAKMKSSDFVLYTSSADDFDPQIEMGYSLNTSYYE